VSGTNTKVAGILHQGALTEGRGPKSKARLAALLEQRLRAISIQGRAAHILKSNDPYTYLGVELIMDLDWSYQHKRMTSKLEHKLSALMASFLTPRMTQTAIAIAIIPSLVYASPVTPCEPGLLAQLDNLSGRP